MLNSYSYRLVWYDVHKSGNNKLIFSLCHLLRKFFSCQREKFFSSDFWTGLKGNINTNNFPS